MFVLSFSSHVALFLCKSCVLFDASFDRRWSQYFVGVLRYQNHRCHVGCISLRCVVSFEPAFAGLAAVMHKVNPKVGLPMASCSSPLRHPS